VQACPLPMCLRICSSTRALLLCLAALPVLSVLPALPVLHVLPILYCRKWWASGASDPRCAVAIFMGKTDPSAPTQAQQSMVLAPMDAPGLTIVRPLPVFGFDDAPHGHSELVFEGVQVPAANMLLGGWVSGWRPAA